MERKESTKPVCKAIIKVVDKLIAETLQKEVALTIKDKLSKKYTESDLDKFI